MKVNIIVHSISYAGGVSKASIDLANALIIEGVEVNIISLGGESEPKYRLDNNITIIDLKMPKPSTSYYKVPLKSLWFVDAIKKLSRILRISQSKDVAWIFTSPPLCMLAGILKLKYKQAVFIGHEHTTSAYTKGKVADSIRYKLYRNLDTLISLTEPDKKKYESFGIKSTYIPNFITTSPNHLVNNRKYALFVGRFSEEKRPLLALELYRQSNLKNEGIKLKMFGSGPLEQNVRNYIELYDLKKYIEVYNNVNETDEIYKDGYILLMTSDTEGFGLVLVEAISRNIPCISFDIPYGPQSIIINNINGFLVKPDDYNTYIDKLKSSNLLGFINRDISKTVEKYSKDSIVPIWLNLIQELLNK